MVYLKFSSTFSNNNFHLLPLTVLLFPKDCECKDFNTLSTRLKTLRSIPSSSCYKNFLLP